MSVRKPEEWPSQFEKKVYAGELEGATALYEPVAAFLRDSKEVIVGHEGVRTVLGDLIREKVSIRKSGGAVCSGGWFRGALKKLYGKDGAGREGPRGETGD